jgi:hypothetical protein
MPTCKVNLLTDTKAAEKAKKEAAKAVEKAKKAAAAAAKKATFKAKFEDARRMLLRGMTLAEAAEITELPIEKLQVLAP